MHVRHAQEAREFQIKALERLREIAVAELSAGDVVRFFVEAVKIERLARGEPDSVQEQRKGEGDGSDITNLVIADQSAADLACQLLERMAAGGHEPRGSGMAGQSEEVAAGLPPGLAEPQTS
jgi:hypothetical protein